MTVSRQFLQTNICSGVFFNTLYCSVHDVLTLFPFAEFSVKHVILKERFLELVAKSLLSGFWTTFIDFFPSPS